MINQLLDIKDTQLKDKVKCWKKCISWRQC